MEFLGCPVITPTKRKPTTAPNQDTDDDESSGASMGEAVLGDIMASAFSGVGAQVLASAGKEDVVALVTKLVQERR